jgi:membrane protease YdiL (CAAX protease family)
VLLVTPIVKADVVTRDVLTARVSAGPFILAFASSCFYAGLMLSAAARTFTSEQLVSPTWEPISLRGLRRLGTGARRIPAVDEVGVRYAAVLLLLFYISPSLARHGLFTVIAVNQFVLIAGTTMLFAWIGRYDWREVFSLRRPDIAGLAAAALMGVGLALAIDLLSWLQSRFWQQPEAARRMQMELFARPLLEHPVLTVIAIGVTAGICEELMFRGAIQSALGKRMRFWPTILIGSFLFAFLHLDLHGLPLRMLIALPLAWLVWRGGSIWPAMLMHALYNSTQMARLAWEARGKTYDQLTQMVAVIPQSLAASDWLRIAIGAGLFAVGWILVFVLLRRNRVTQVPFDR